MGCSGTTEEFSMRGRGLARCHCARELYRSMPGRRGLLSFGEQDRAASLLDWDSIMSRSFLTPSPLHGDIKPEAGRFRRVLALLVRPRRKMLRKVGQRAGLPHANQERKSYHFLPSWPREKSLVGCGRTQGVRTCTGADVFNHVWMTGTDGLGCSSGSRNPSARHMGGRAAAVPRRRLSYQQLVDVCTVRRGHLR